MDEDGKRRKLETPSRSRNRFRDDTGPRGTCTSSRHRGRGDTGPSRSHSRSRSHLGQDRDRKLDVDRERVQRLERELQREREILQQRERSSLRTSETWKTRSRTPTFSTNDVVKIIKYKANKIYIAIKHGLDSQPIKQDSPLLYKNTDHKNILPNFDPAIKNQRIDIWLKKVNECAAVYGWDDRTTIHFSLQKLQGLAKTWFESLDTILYTWPEWQEKLTNAFPHEHNYGQCLEDMLRRKSKFNEPIETYYYEKLALLNLCDITGKRAVDCIIHGISDKTMKSSALALRCAHPEQLLQFLMSNRDTMSFQQSVHFKKRDDNMPDNNNSSAVNSKRNSDLGVFCFNCKERGHPYLQCSKPLLKCNTCNKIGHKTENCFNKSGISSTKTDSECY